MRKIPFFNGKKLRIAFTLAEVLITLLVVGIVATLTIPALMNYIGDLQYTSSLKKNYAVFEQATRQILSENGGNLRGIVGVGTNDVFKNMYLPYLSYTKSCNQGSILNCVVQTIQILPDRTDHPYSRNSGQGSALVLADGTLVRFTDYNRSSAECSTRNHTNCSEIEVDLNGVKGPNAMGNDIFMFALYEDQLKPTGWDDSNALSDCKNSNGVNCTVIKLK